MQKERRKALKEKYYFKPRYQTTYILVGGMF
jgi:hypothetical protein